MKDHLIDGNDNHESTEKSSTPPTKNKVSRKKHKVAVAVYDAKIPMTPEKKVEVLDALKESQKVEDCTKKVRYLYPDNDPTKGSPIAAETTTPRHRLLEDKTRLTIETTEEKAEGSTQESTLEKVEGSIEETTEGEKIKLRGLSLFSQRILIEKSPAQCIIITHQDLENYKKLPLYDTPHITIGPVHLGPKVVPTLPRAQAKQQNSVMHGLSANACMCIVYLLTKSKYDKKDLLKCDAKQLEEICDKEKVSGADESKIIEHLLTLNKYDMGYLLECDDKQLHDICEKENFCGSFVWSHLGAYATCVDQMDTQVPHNLNATPDSTNQWMKNGEDIANKKRKLNPCADIEYTVSSKRQRNPEAGEGGFIAAAEELTQTFSCGGARFSIFTHVKTMEHSRRCVGTRELGEAILKTYLLPKAGIDKENKPPLTAGSTPAIPSSPSFKLKA